MDGFSGGVTLGVDSLPPGVTSKPVVIGPGARWGTVVVDIATTAATFTGPIALKATALIDGKAIIREARPAVVLWGGQPGQNIPVLARLTQSLVLAVRPEKGYFKINPIWPPPPSKHQEARKKKSPGRLLPGKATRSPFRENPLGECREAEHHARRRTDGSQPATLSHRSSAGMQPTKENRKES